MGFVQASVPCWFSRSPAASSPICTSIWGGGPGSRPPLTLARVIGWLPMQSLSGARLGEVPQQPPFPGMQHRLCPAAIRWRCRVNIALSLLPPRPALNGRGTGWSCWKRWRWLKFPHHLCVTPQSLSLVFSRVAKSSSKEAAAWEIAA